MKMLCASLVSLWTAVLLVGCTRQAVEPRAQSASSPRPGAGVLPAARRSKAQSTPLEKLIAGGVEQTAYTSGYDPAYVKLSYPGGDVPRERGVCADVIVRAFRQAGVDLQKELHEDMTRHFTAYPQKWGAARPDANIDHRRVANLMTFFERRQKGLPLSKQAGDYAPGDVVAWDLGNGLLHIGLVTDVRAGGNSPYQIVHNIGAGAKLEDVLFAWRVIGHYCYFQPEALPQPGAGAKSPSKPGRHSPHRRGTPHRRT